MDTSAANPNWLILVITSGVVGALVSSVVGAISGAWTTKKQTEVRKMEVAMQLLEFKHKQGEMALSGKFPGVNFYDPAFSLLEYMKALDEIESSRTWKFGEDVVKEREKEK